MLWIEEQFCHSKVESLSQDLGLSNLVVNLLLSRGIGSKEEAITFLNPKLAQLSDPLSIPNLENASSRICKAILENEHILIVGDYDVDGISSTVIVQKTLTSLGGSSKYVIPHRKTEGYGLSMEVIRRGMQKGNFSLIIALDCGTNSFKEAEFLAKNSVDLVVVDHHKAKGKIHPSAIIINPHLDLKSEKIWRDMCTAGLCFKLVHGIIKQLREQGNELSFGISPRDYLALTALGTLADMVPLTGENRILAKYGLKHLRKNPDLGLNKLIKIAKFNTAFPFQSEDVTFRIAPRINACGRLDSPETAAELLLSENSNEASELVSKMDDFNEQRKKIETRLTEKAIEQAEAKFSLEKGIVVLGKGSEWNPGVVGIVAGKLSNRFNKPCLVLGYDGGNYKGSGRSNEDINLVDALSFCKDYLVHWGGHPAAVGLTVNEFEVDHFIEKFLSFLDGHTHENTEKKVKIDTIVNSSEICEELLHEVEKLGPFGQENPEPIFALKEIILKTKPRRIGNGDHFQFRIEDENSSIQGIAWNMSERIPPSLEKIDLAFKLRWNRWQNRNSLQVVLQDWKISN